MASRRLSNAGEREKEQQKNHELNEGGKRGKVHSQLLRVKKQLFLAILMQISSKKFFIVL